MHTKPMSLLALLAASCAWTGQADAGVASPALCPVFLDGLEFLPLGALSAEAGKPIHYVTRGGYTITIDLHTITIVDPIAQNRVEHWGDPHENLNGKHIKDWEGEQRTIVLDDGARITLEAAGPQGVVVHTSIYDGRQNVQIDNTSNAVLHTSTSLADTLCRERSQYDGEAAHFSTDIQTGIAVYRQIHVENAAFEITPNTQMLGSSGGFENPNQVRDFYDDPRLGHT